jgi:hypothetical protein
MHRLHPAGLFLLGLNLIAPGDIEQRGSAVAQQRDKTFSHRAVFRDDVFGIGPRQGRNYLSVVAPRGAPARLHGFDNGDVDAGLAQMQRRRQSRKTAADHDDVSGHSPDKFRQLRT